MSGHSKWSTIKRKKEKTDNQRAKIFTKIGREIAVAVREGGPDPASNSKLKDIISKAKANNVPNDNIDRIIKKAAGVQKGSGTPHTVKVAKITREQVRQIAEQKRADLNSNDLDAAEKIIAGTARSMGITVE